MTFGLYLHFALFYTALSTLPGAVLAFPVAWRHWRNLSIENPYGGAEVSAAGFAIMISLGTIFHVIGEILYKGGRIYQFFVGVDSTESAVLVTEIAAIAILLSLTCMFLYLNQLRPFWRTGFWVGHAALIVWSVFGWGMGNW